MTIRSRIVDCLSRARRPMTHRQIADAIDEREGSVGAICATLAKAKVIECAGRDKPRHRNGMGPKLWRLAAATKISELQAGKCPAEGAPGASGLDVPQTAPAASVLLPDREQPAPFSEVVTLHIHREQAKHLQRERSPRSLRPVFTGPAPRRCQWIEGEPSAEDACKCGQPSVEGRPYCSEHTARAYVKRGAEAESQLAAE